MQCSTSRLSPPKALPHRPVLQPPPPPFPPAGCPTGARTWSWTCGSACPGAGSTPSWSREAPPARRLRCVGRLFGFWEAPQDALEGSGVPRRLACCRQSTVPTLHLLSQAVLAGAAAALGNHAGAGAAEHVHGSAHWRWATLRPPLTGCCTLLVGQRTHAVQAAVACCRSGMLGSGGHRNPMSSAPSIRLLRWQPLCCAAVRPTPLRFALLPAQHRQPAPPGLSCRRVLPDRDHPVLHHQAPAGALLLHHQPGGASGGHWHPGFPAQLALAMGGWCIGACSGGWAPTWAHL